MRKVQNACVARTYFFKLAKNQNMVLFISNSFLLASADRGNANFESPLPLKEKELDNEARCRILSTRKAQ